MRDLPSRGLSPCLVCGSDGAKRIDLDNAQTLLYRCLNCRVVHWGHEWTSQEALAHYRDYYTGKPPEYDPINAQRYHAILDRFEQIKPPGGLLDVGCGMGHFLAVAESRGWQVVGLELSESGLRLLDRVREERGWQFQVRGGDLLRAGFTEASFRAVTLFEVLEHLNDPVANLRKIHALLEPGGILYLTTPNFDSLSRYALGSRCRIITMEHLFLFNPLTLRRCLEAAGFRVVVLSTKNLDVPEILIKRRRRGQTAKPPNTFPSTRAFRRAIEGSPWLRLLKAVANAALRLSRLGETIEALAIKSDRGLSG